MRGPDRKSWHERGQEGDTMTDLQQTKWEPGEGSGCGEEQRGHDWKSGEQQNQTGKRNRSEKGEQTGTAGEGEQDDKEEPPV